MKTCRDGHIMLKKAAWSHTVGQYGLPVCHVSTRTYQLMMTPCLGNNKSLTCKKFAFAILILEGVLFKVGSQIEVVFPRGSSYHWPTQDYNLDFPSPSGIHKTPGSLLLLMKILNTGICTHRAFTDNIKANLRLFPKYQIQHIDTNIIDSVLLWHISLLSKLIFF